ncbi:hypothetical protein [Psychrobacter sp. LV10R520-6]|uniref:hypothetical protein n=1 Tax=Psychrobacter sp. LV10R520-6 TaxID=1415574 RepID=UPI0024C566B1|nr:hypothetical protein [Psychrobacter sp. LV10R520-6]SNT69549.1 hypothetical protein SAMN04488491_0642 [Psychrobacter sp. LV10R520-6]
MSIGLVVAGIVVYIVLTLKKYKYANDVGSKSMSEWCDILENSNAKQREQMSHSLILFSGKTLEKEGVLPKNGLRNGIILNREVSKPNFIVLVCEEAANLDSFDIEYRERALDATNARYYFSYCLTLILAARGPHGLTNIAFKSRYPIDGFSIR